MAIIKSTEGVRINASNSTNANWGCGMFASTRTWAAYQSGINMFQIYQNGATSIKETVSISLRWAAIRTEEPKTELPALHATARLGLNTNGQISVDSGLDWQSWGGNGILWPYCGMGGSSAFIGANSGSSTGIMGSVWITVCTMAWDKLVIVHFTD